MRLRTEKCASQVGEKIKIKKYHVQCIAEKDRRLEMKETRNIDYLNHVCPRQNNPFKEVTK